MVILLAWPRYLSKVGLRSDPKTKAVENLDDNVDFGFAQIVREVCTLERAYFFSCEILDS